MSSIIYLELSIHFSNILLHPTFRWFVVLKKTGKCIMFTNCHTVLCCIFYDPRMEVEVFNFTYLVHTHEDEIMTSNIQCKTMYHILEVYCEVFTIFLKSNSNRTPDCQPFHLLDQISSQLKKYCNKCFVRV